LQGSIDAEDESDDEVEDTMMDADISKRVFFSTLKTK